MEQSTKNDGANPPLQIFLGIMIAGGLWFVTTVGGWFAGMAAADESGMRYATIATVIPVVALAILYLVTRRWRAFALTVLITSCILVTITGACNYGSIEKGKPPRIAG